MTDYVTAAVYMAAEDEVGGVEWGLEVSRTHATALDRVGQCLTRNGYSAAEVQMAQAEITTDGIHVATSLGLVITVSAVGVE